MKSISAFIVLKDGVQVASYSTEHPFSPFKAFCYAKQNMTNYGGIILSRDSNGGLSSVDYSKFSQEQ